MAAPANIETKGGYNNLYFAFVKNFKFVQQPLESLFLLHQEVYILPPAVKR